MYGLRKWNWNEKWEYVYEEILLKLEKRYHIMNTYVFGAFLYILYKIVDLLLHL